MKRRRQMKTMYLCKILRTVCPCKSTGFACVCMRRQSTKGLQICSSSRTVTIDPLLWQPLRFVPLFRFSMMIGSNLRSVSNSETEPLMNRLLRAFVRETYMKKILFFLFFVFKRHTVTQGKIYRCILLLMCKAPFPKHLFFNKLIR